MNETKCRLCKKPLHKASSVKRGMGSVCYKKDKRQLKFDFDDIGAELFAASELPAAARFYCPKNKEKKTHE